MWSRRQRCGRAPMRPPSAGVKTVLSSTSSVRVWPFSKKGRPPTMRRFAHGSKRVRGGLASRLGLPRSPRQIHRRKPSTCVKAKGVLWLGTQARAGQGIRAASTSSATATDDRGSRHEHERWARRRGRDDSRSGALQHSSSWPRPMESTAPTRTRAARIWARISTTPSGSGDGLRLRSRARPGSSTSAPAITPSRKRKRPPAQTSAIPCGRSCRSKSSTSTPAAGSPATCSRPGRVANERGNKWQNASDGDDRAR